MQVQIHYIPMKDFEPDNSPLNPYLYIWLHIYTHIHRHLAWWDLRREGREFSSWTRLIYIHIEKEMRERERGIYNMLKDWSWHNFCWYIEKERITCCPQYPTPSPNGYCMSKSRWFISLLTERIRAWCLKV